jgi:hypothetical protein
MKLLLGVLDIPYEKQAPRRVGVRRRGGRTTAFSAPASGGQTTGDVAEILEAKYHVMEVFVEEHLDDITGALGQSLSDALEDAMGGAPGGNATTAAEADIQAMFNKFIDSSEMEGLGIPGVPTQAALKGINHRLLHPYAKSNPRRPSFKDTGQYEQTFRAVFEK